MQNETRMVNKYELPGINSGMQRMTGHQKTIGANLNDFIIGLTQCLILGLYYINTQ